MVVSFLTATNGARYLLVFGIEIDLLFFMKKRVKTRSKSMNGSHALYFLSSFFFDVIRNVANGDQAVNIFIFNFNAKFFIATKRELSKLKRVDTEIRFKSGICVNFIGGKTKAFRENCCNLFHYVHNKSPIPPRYAANKNVNLIRKYPII